MSACAGAEPQPASVEPMFDVQALTSYREARDCRNSIEHELRHVRVLVNELGAAAYDALDPSAPYPVGSQLVKLAYEDEACTKLVAYTAIEKRAPGSYPAAGDWHWQRLDADLRVVEDGAPAACVSCHRNSCDHGYDYTCTAH